MDKEIRRKGMKKRERERARGDTREVRLYITSVKRVNIPTH